MNDVEDKGLLWQLISEVAALNGHVTVDSGTQTDLARYHAIVPLGSINICLFAAYNVSVGLSDLFSLGRLAEKPRMIFSDV